MADDKDKVVGGVSGFSVLIILAVIFSFWLANNDPNAIKNQSGSGSGSGFGSGNTFSSQTANQQLTSSERAENYIDKSSGQTKIYSPYHNQVNINMGTSASTDEPNQEYVIIYANGNQNPINISGWTFKNGRDKKLFVVSGQTVRGQSVSAKIPSSGATLYNPFNPSVNRYGPITLKSGERAVIVTGNPPSTGSVTIKDNFKINRCTGYLEDHPIDQNGSHFNLDFRYNCPTSYDLPSVDDLDDVCHNYVQSISGCHQPTQIFDQTNGYCLDRNCRLSSYCQSFIKQNFNPQTCFALFSADKNFVSSEWVVFLNRTWELWDSQRETISLYDQNGLLVNEISY